MLKGIYFVNSKHKVENFLPTIGFELDTFVFEESAVIAIKLQDTLLVL